MDSKDIENPHAEEDFRAQLKFEEQEKALGKISHLIKSLKPEFFNEKSRRFEKQIDQTRANTADPFSELRVLSLKVQKQSLDLLRQYVEVTKQIDEFLEVLK
jgi:hypothetical protein